MDLYAQLTSVDHSRPLFAAIYNIVRIWQLEKQEISSSRIVYFQLLFINIYTGCPAGYAKRVIIWERIVLEYIIGASR